MELGFDGSMVVVTASSADLGRASAAALAGEGANVVIRGRDPECLVTTKSELGDLDGNVLGAEADIMNKGDVEVLAEATVKEFGGVDHVVTLASGMPPDGFTDPTEREWYGALDILVMSAVWVVRAARPHLEANNVGTITCITSTSIKEVIGGPILSNVVRHGVIGLAKSLSHELAPGVRVNAALPDTHEAGRIEELAGVAVERDDHDTCEEDLDSWSGGIPLGRVGDLCELGDMVAFLASDRVSFVTGVRVPVDGGRLRGV